MHSPMRWRAVALVLLVLAVASQARADSEGCGCGGHGTNRRDLVAALSTPEPAVAGEGAIRAANDDDVIDQKRSDSSQDRQSLSCQSNTPEAAITLPKGMVLIPGGVFTMGTDDPAIPLDGEAPARRVRIRPFFLHEKEVSVRDFAAFVHETGHVTEAESFGWSFCFIGTLSPQTLAKVDKQVEAVPWWVPVFGADWAHPNGPDSSAVLNHPVTHVSHSDARAYCEWASFRLPREAEFERAMRGGLENASFPWGNDLTPGNVHKANLWQGHFPDVNLVLDGFKWASPVDSFGPQNAYGLYNIVGNVWEWVADAWVADHAKYIKPGAELVDPQIELQGQLESKTVERVKRGGSYMCHESYCYRYRTASRSHNSADSSAQNLGFRCASDVPEQPQDE